MTDPAAPPAKSQSFSRRVRDLAEAYPEVLSIVVYAVLAIGTIAVGYLMIFSVFAPYDDEGTLLLTLKAFSNGEALYRDIYSSYGPFFFEVFGAFFKLTGSSVTTDAGRTIVIVIWTLCSLLFGIVTQRLTGFLALGAAAMVASFSVLAVLANEPMHPQGLCVLLLACFFLLVTFEPGRRVLWSGGVAGAILAALLLTKLNIGIFAIAGAVLAAVWVYAPLQRQRWLRLLVVAGFLAMPLLIMDRDLNLSWVRELLLIEFFAALALLIAARPLAAQAGEQSGRFGRWLLAGLVGFGVAFVAIVVIVLLTGPSVSDVYDGVVTQALKVRDVLVFQLVFPGAAVDWAVAAVAAAALIAPLRRSVGAAAALWSGLFRAAAGLVILLVVAHVTPLALNPSSANPDLLPMLLAWVAAMPLTDLRESTHRRFLRLALPAIALAETLQVYPVAGSQIGIAAVVFVPVGALCLGDAVVELRRWSAARGPLSAERLRAVLAVTTTALAVALFLNIVALPAASNAVAYRDNPKLALPGASELHLNPLEVGTYEGIVGLLHRYGCTAFVGYPSINSLYLWSGLEAPPPQIPNAWMSALNAEQQQRIVDEVSSSPRPCVVKSVERAEKYLQGSPPPDLPLVHYIFHDFKPVAASGDFQLLLPKSRVRAAAGES